jgi:trans-aconitate 3-methyltransferase
VLARHQLVDQRDPYSAMATFAKGVYDAAAYNAFRPVYPRKLFDSIWAYHRLGRGKEAEGWHRAVDLGCGTGDR